MDTSQLDVGIIGILDIDIGAGQITLGVMLDFEISQLLSVQIPIQLFYDWNDPSSWHFWIGTIQSPASAKILGIVRGGGYFMMGGQAIQPFPPGSNTALPGVAVAMGISAAVVWGSQSAGIYLKVAASADFGVSFSPHLFILGDVHLEGSLHLLVVNIGATGDFLLTAPNPVFLKVHVCGSVSFFFFSVSACVDFTIGNDSTPLPPPPLISTIYLQSFAPVIAQGQGDRPIDASLGNALLVGSGGTTPIPVVPIDTVPVIQMLYGVDVSAVSSTFTQPLPACPTFPGAPGVNLGGGRFAQYQITSLSISPALPGGFPAPPVAWRPNMPSSDTSQTQVDLALFSRNPNVTNSALERSDNFSNMLSATWGDTCAVVAPAACVFWAFCGQRIGPSPNGWVLTGIPTPDPPNTTRLTPVPTQMQVSQPALSASDQLLLSLGLPLVGEGLAPAQVIGIGGSTPSRRLPCLRAVELPELVALSFQSNLAAGFNSSEKNVPPETAAAAGASAQQLAASGRWLQFNVGGSQRIRILLTLGAALFKQMHGTSAQGWVTIQELNAAGTVMASHPLMALNPVIITTANVNTSLPSTWTALTSPWRDEVASILELLFGQPSTNTLFVEFQPNAATVTIEVVVTSPANFPAEVLIGAIESCPTSETVRYQNGLSIQQSTIETINTYLDGGSPVPLLAPNTVYTITLAYDVLDTEPGANSTTTTTSTQAYQFQTDSQPPTRLDPYVLCSFPAQLDTCVFYEDPLDIVFNDSSVFSLFEAYGYQLTYSLHAADGLPEGSPASTMLTGSPSPLQAIDGIGTATYDSMLQLASTLECLGGTITQYQNQLFTAPVYLRPLMGYTFDLVTNPGAPANSAAGSPGSAAQPLFRRNFTTGRYANLQALAASLGATQVTHRPLTSALSFPNSGGAQVFKDADIQQAFLSAGEQALPAPSTNSIVIYWLKSGTGYVPHAILLDAIEPLWRYRSEPGFTTPISSDPSFKIVTINSVPSLEVSEAAGSPPAASIGSFIVSPGGARTVAMFSAGFSPPASGKLVTLQMQRPASSVYGNGDENAPIVTLIIQPQAPWENDHV